MAASPDRETCYHTVKRQYQALPYAAAFDEVIQSLEQLHAHGYGSMTVRFKGGCMTEIEVTETSISDA